VPASLRGAAVDELEALARFVAELQQRPESNVPFFGRTPGDVAAELESWSPTWSESCLVAEDGGRIAGFVGADADEELGRAWIHGPFASASHWPVLADELLTACIELVTARGVRDLELAGDVANTRLRQLALGHGFEPRSASKSLTITRDRALELPPEHVPPLEAGLVDAFVALHETLFPATYYSGAQLVAQHARGDAVVLALVEDGELTGYAAGRIDATGQGYVDFVGVTERSRGGGRGGRLVTALCRTLVARSDCTHVALTVYEDNLPALAVYDRLGFEPEASMVGFRRRPLRGQDP
jgi:ribosomal protein S18 acetylase RimI-like enzyme